MTLELAPDQPPPVCKSSPGPVWKTFYKVAWPAIDALRPFAPKSNEKRDFMEVGTGKSDVPIEQCQWIFDKVEARREQLERKAQSNFAVIAFLTPLVSSIFVFGLREPALNGLARSITQFLLVVAATMLVLGFIASVRAVAIKARVTLFLDAVIDPETNLFRKYSKIFHARGLLHCASENTTLNDHIAQLVKCAHALAAGSLIVLAVAAIPAGIAFSQYSGGPTKTTIVGPVHISPDSFKDLRSDVATPSENTSIQAAALTRLDAALRDKEVQIRAQQATIAELEKRLSQSTNKSADELSPYRSEFFAALSNLLLGHKDVRVIGDRFVFPSEILFSSGSALLDTYGERQLEHIAHQLIDISTRMPKDVHWVLQVEGHTDNRPINTMSLPSNWELSSARAITVVKFLNRHGVPNDHLVAASYGEFQPLLPNEDSVGQSRNRRIELKLTTR